MTSKEKESIYNIFLFVIKDIVCQIGATVHNRYGSDEEKIAFLQSQVKADFRKSRRFQLPKEFVLIDAEGKQLPGKISYESFKELQRQGMLMRVIEFVFEAFGDSELCPLMVITPIVDGMPRIDAETDLTLSGKEQPK